MTTPNNTVAGLPEKWREMAEKVDQRHQPTVEDMYERDALLFCANDLKAALASPAPSAPVVDDAMVSLVRRLRDYFERINNDDEGDDYLNISCDAMDEIDVALTPPAAAPRVDHDWQAVSGSSAKKCARCGVLSDRLDGVFPKPCATPAASDEGDQP